MGFNLGASNNSGKLKLSGFLSNDITDAVERDIPIEQLVPWENQPFKMYNDFKLHELAESIKENGLLSRIIVYPMSDGNYRIIAGHNRVEACRIAGITNIPSIVKNDIDDNRAKLIMVDTNLCQRMEFLPSERAFAYKTQQEALVALGSPRATADIAEKYGENRRTIQRYIACARLTPKLMNMLDEGRITIKAGAKLSSMPEVSQNEVAAYLKNNPQKSFSDDEAKRIADKKFFSEPEIEDIIMGTAPPKTMVKMPKQPSTSEDEVINEVICEEMPLPQEETLLKGNEDKSQISVKDVTPTAEKESVDDRSALSDITISREKIDMSIGDKVSNNDVADYIYYCLQRRDIFDEWLATKGTKAEDDI